MARSQVHRAVLRGSGYVWVLKQRDLHASDGEGIVYQERSTCIFGAVVALPHYPKPQPCEGLWAVVITAPG